MTDKLPDNAGYVAAFPIPEVLQGINAFTRGGAHHDEGAGRRGTPAFLRCADQHINATSFHVYPDCSGSHAIKHEQATNSVNSLSDGAQIVIG